MNYGFGGFIVDPTGNAKYVPEEVVPLGAARGLARARVASWDDGLSLWRTALTGDFYFESTETKTTPTEISRFCGRSFHRWSVVPRRVDGRIDHSGVTAHFRWIIRALGLDRNPSFIPFETRSRGVWTVDSPTIQNPWIGRFRGRTHEEVLQDALDSEEIVDAYRRKWGEKNDWSVKVAEPLFPEGGASIVTVHSRVQAVEGHAETYVRVFSGGELGTVELGARFDVSYDEPLHEIVRTLENVYADSPKHRSWYVLPQDDADAWWRDHSVAGRLSMPDEEVALHEALGEELPYLWPTASFVEWATSRWPAP